MTQSGTLGERFPLRRVDVRVDRRRPRLPMEQMFRRPLSAAAETLPDRGRSPPKKPHAKFAKSAKKFLNLRETPPHLRVRIFRGLTHPGSPIVLFTCRRMRNSAPDGRSITAFQPIFFPIPPIFSKLLTFFKYFPIYRYSIAKMSV